MVHLSGTGLLSAFLAHQNNREHPTFHPPSPHWLPSSISIFISMKWQRGGRPPHLLEYLDRYGWRRALIYTAGIPWPERAKSSREDWEGEQTSLQTFFLDAITSWTWFLGHTAIMRCQNCGKEKFLMKSQHDSGCLVTIVVPWWTDLCSDWSLPLHHNKRTKVTEVNAMQGFIFLNAVVLGTCISNS